MSWSGHWHGFGPWVGPPERYFQEGGRRPPHPIQPAPGSKEEQRYREAAAEFPTSHLPPMMPGHWLLKRNQASTDRTWADASEAVHWLTKLCLDNPPFEREDGKQTYSSLEEKQEYAFDALPRGVDVSRVHYNGARSIVSINVVCCPNLHHPEIPCPLPPG